MRVATNLAQSSLGFNMTPMIDVVFLLIIFFLVSSHMAQQESLLELQLPGASSGHRNTVDEVRRVVVNILPEPDREGQIMVAGRTMPIEQFSELVRFEARESKQNLEIRIRADHKVPYRVVEPLLLACAEAGVWNVTFAVVAK